MTANETDLRAFFKLTRGALILRGIIFIIIGILFFINPAALIRIITIIVGAYLLVESGLLWAGAMRNKGSIKALLLFNSIVMFILGVAAIIIPFWFAEFWMIVGGIWLLIGGLQYITMPAGNKAARRGEIITGSISIISGLVLVLMPFYAAEFIASVVGVLLIFTGIAVLGLAAAVGRA